MLETSTKTERSDPNLGGTTNTLSRRKFFGMMGAGSALVVVAASCKKHHGPYGGAVDLGSGDTGILNYAYALEQLEAAFYTWVIAHPYEKISEMEKSYLTDVRDHEIAHREFFKAALSTSAIKQLEVDFSSVDFRSRNSVLATAKAFEDLGVSAYNGAGKLITNPDYLTLAGKIVSVEARHAALIRDLISAGSFADMTVVDSNGLDVARSPNDVLAIAGAFIKTKLDASHLPTS
ncbi:MAG: ferritin-like domain-containing protein [Bacteroidota bacterium]|nr:ferritin-like domain-containing protein [Bacteroidota bacterium]